MWRAFLAVSLLALLVAIGLVYGWNFYPQVWRVILGPRARPLRSLTFQRSAARLERGRYLVLGPLNCFRCHSDRDWSQPGAPPVSAREGAGHIYREEGFPWLVAPNLTPDCESGTGLWTDDMLARAIREGVGHDGRALHPEMPYRTFRYLTDEDLASVVVYLRSVSPIRNSQPQTRMPWRSRLRFTGMPQPLTQPQGTPPTETALYGGYTAAIADCVACHTLHNRPGTEVNGKLFGGGNRFTSPLGTIFTPNITLDASGIGYYDETLFIRVLRSGRVGTSRLNPSMPWYWLKNMSDHDLKAVFAGLRAASLVKHLVDNTEAPTWCRRCRQNPGGGSRN